MNFFFLGIAWTWTHNILASIAWQTRVCQYQWSLLEVGGSNHNSINNNNNNNSNTIDGMPLHTYVISRFLTNYEQNNFHCCE